MRGTKDQNTTAASAMMAIGSHASVPAAQYYEIAKQHLQANGGKGVVVKERETPDQWRAWLAYFAHLDDETSPRGKKALTFRSMRNGATVPAEWPIQFDLSAPSWALVEPNEDLPSPQRRRELAAMLRAVVAGWDISADGRKTRPPDVREAPSPELKAQAIAYHEARLAELAEAGPPAVNTPDMASYLAGMRAQDAEDLAS